MPPVLLRILLLLLAVQFSHAAKATTNPTTAAPSAVFLPPVARDPTAKPTPRPTDPTARPSDPPTRPTLNPIPSPTNNPTTNDPTLANNPVVLISTSAETETVSTEPTTSNPETTSIITSDGISSSSLSEIGNNDNQLGVSNQNDPLNSLPAIPTEMFCLLFTICLLLFFVYSLQSEKNGKSNDVIMGIKLPAYIAFILNILGIISILVISVIMYSSNEYTTDIYNMLVPFYYILIVAYSFGKFMMECFYILRLFYAFKGSLFELSSNLCYLLISIMWIISCLWFYFFIIQQQDITTNNVFYVPAYRYIILAIVESLFVFFLLYLFTKRLSVLVIMQREKDQSTILDSSNRSSVDASTEIESNETINSSATSTEYGAQSPTVSTTVSTTKSVKSVIEIKSDLNVEQKNIISLISRCILLSNIALITTLLFGIFEFYVTQYGGQIYILYSLWTIDFTVNCFCLYLNFKFTDSLYKKCCSYPNKLFEHIIQCFFAAKIRNITKNEMMMGEIIDESSPTTTVTN